jgi:hypothetical protein
LFLDGEKFKIISIVKDFNLRGPQEKLTNGVYASKDNTIDVARCKFNFVKVKGENIEETMSTIEQFGRLKSMRISVLV